MPFANLFTQRHSGDAFVTACFINPMRMVLSHVEPGNKPGSRSLACHNGHL
jgi:hypothetical protein